jgi:uncharacterized protein (DUF427 family)
MPKTDIDQAGGDLLSARAIIEPSSRWVRVQFNDEYIADTKEALLLRRGPGRLAYYFPEKDIRMEYLEPTGLGSEGREYFDVRVDNKFVKGAAWMHSDPGHDMLQLKGLFAFHWRRMDHWFEEEEEIFGHPRDPYHRVDILRSSRNVRVELEGTVLAETNRPTLLYETDLPPRYYIPAEDVRMAYLEQSRVKTVCPYKGSATYWSVNVGGEIYDNLVWVYNAPLPEAGRIAGMPCFFNENIDLFVDGELQERPQTPWS